MNRPVLLAIFYLIIGVILTCLCWSCSSAVSLGAMHRLAVLPNAVHETSGLVYSDSVLLTQNDGGNPASVSGFRLGDYSANHTVLFPSAQNIDWEELSRFDSLLVIADIGNNFNTRDSFTLYLTPLQSIVSQIKSTQKGITSAPVVNKPQLVRFTIPNKPKSGGEFVLSAFDMEAATQIGTSFFVFTKNWQTQQSLAYEVSCQKSGEAQLRDTLPFRGLVTSACTLPNGLIAFVGYRSYIPFVALCQYNDQGFSLISFRRFWGHWACQTEGICFVTNKGLLISAENTPLRRQALYWVKVRQGNGSH